MLQFGIVCSHSTIVSYVFFIIPCNTLQFGFLFSLFLLLCFPDTNNPRPSIADAIGGSHRFLPPAAPQYPMVVLPFWPPELNRLSAHISLSPAVPPDQSILPSLLLKNISNRDSKFCDTVLSFLVILPAPPRHFWTDTPSAVSQYHIFYHIICPSKQFSNRHAKRYETVPCFP